MVLMQSIQMWMGMGTFRLKDGMQPLKIIFKRQSQEFDILQCPVGVSCVELVCCKILLISSTLRVTKKKVVNTTSENLLKDYIKSKNLAKGSKEEGCEHTTGEILLKESIFDGDEEELGLIKSEHLMTDSDDFFLSHPVA